MTVKVETYYNPKKWKEHETFLTIKGEIHICATKNMTEGIKERYRNDELGEFQYIFTIQQVMTHIFGRWHAPEDQLAQYLSLSKVINDTPGEQHLKDAFRNNTAELLDTIRFLAFCGVRPESLKRVNELADKEKFFGNVWYELEKQNSLYNDLRKLLKGQWKMETIHKHLNAILESRFKKGKDIGLEIPNTKKRIILHGFYFITPEQQEFLKLLEQSGFEMVFFQFYDERFPNTFDFSKAFISNHFGWTDNWNIQKAENKRDTIGSRFLQSFEGGIQEKRHEEKKVLAYESFFDFLHSVIIEHYPIGGQHTEQGKDVEIIATNADILNEILVQYYPERFADRRNFLNYPVGQFILKIHEMRQGRQLILSNDILMATFSSGWLTDKRTKENAQNYTYELEQLLPFFSNCVNIDDWLERMKTLLNQYENILPLFESEGDNRVLESIRSPFAKISYLSFEKQKVIQISKFFLLLKDMAEDLFYLSNDETSINEHFTRLSNLLKEYNPVNNKVLLQKEEEELITKISYKISTINDNHQFLYEDIGKAIQFYLSGNFSDEEETFIKPFIEVDGEAFKKSNRKIYLTGLDEQGLPLGEFSTPWPLQEKTFESLSETHQVLELGELRNKSVKRISRYLLFITLESLWDERLELSWIRNFLDRENLQPAVYIQYLNMDTESHAFDMGKEKEKVYNQFDFMGYLPDESALQDTLEELKYEDVLSEYELCPRRFYFGYVLDRYPTFSDEFIYQFIFSEITKIVKRSTGNDDEAVIQMVSDLFPQWTTYQKENMTRTSLRYVGNGKDKHSQISGNVSVSNTRRNFQFPGLKNKKREEIYEGVGIKKEQIMDAIQNPNPNLSTTMEANPGYHCRFCPFLDLCPEGQYSVDEKGKK